MKPETVCLWLIVLVFGFCVWTSIHTETKCVDMATVVYVGTCDEHGYCAVGFPDHSYSRELRPKVGEEVCRRHEEVFEW